MNPGSLIVRSLGRRDYEPVWRAMRRFTEQRSEDTPDELWLVEHDAVFTQGLAGKPEHVLAAGRIPVIRTDRGGQVTYHGPGQLVAYPLLDIERLGLGVRSLVRLLEQSMIDVLAQWGITASAREDAPGVYVDGAKIGSLGLKIRRGCSYHGLALNVDGDLEPFGRINPCGFSGQLMTRMSDRVGAVDRQRLARVLARRLALGLGLDCSFAAPDDEARSTSRPSSPEAESKPE